MQFLNNKDWVRNSDYFVLFYNNFDDLTLYIFNGLSVVVSSK